ncbi:sialin-like isoform X2 [Paramacrobiotus metropolitanus]|nr:sialin-like isoform X2 [Paramacrobiotus metropolitanus]
MVNTTVITSNASINITDACPRPNINDTGTVPHAGKFDWDGKTQGLILSSFFYGVILTQIPGGWLSKRFGAKHPFGLAVLLSGLLALFQPLAASWHYGALLTLRALQGVVQGVSMPAAHQLMGLWAPPNERSRMVMITFTGIQIGTVVALILSGVLIQNLGWESGFYFFGGLAFIWYAGWLYFAYDSPSVHPRITPTEKQFILDSIGHAQPLMTTAVPQTPWRQILTSLPVWAICVGNFGHNWGFYTLLTNIPSYLGKVLHYNIQSNGIISAMPYLAMAVVMQLAGWMGDVLRQKKIISVTWIRRGFHFVGQVLPAGCLVGLGFIGCDHNAAVAFLILALATNGISNVGFTVNHVDLSPKYAGILMGWSQTWGSIPGIVAPYLVGLLTDPENMISQWRIVFAIAAAVYFVTCTFYALTASGERQQWEPQPNADNSNTSKP